jgi:glycosyltransferase involved in cell wall biosynthesis
MHDLLEATSSSDGDVVRDGPVLCPLSYANDEPVSSILQAAAECPELTFILTGKASERIKMSAPANVRFSGYVSAGEYRDLVASSLAVVAMTTRDFTMQRAGYEALMAGKPQVTADFPVLREFLGEAALYAVPDSAAQIAAAIREIKADPVHYSDSAFKVLEAAIGEQGRTLSSLQEIV